MNVNIDFDLSALQDAGSLELVADFLNITNVTNCAFDADQITIVFLSDEQEWEIQFYKNEVLLGYGTFTDYLNCLVDPLNSHITFNWNGENVDYLDLETLIQKNVIKVSPNTGSTLVICHRLNDEKDAINKKLQDVTMIAGNFKTPLGIKNIELDVINYDINDSYNYIYIPRLNRYYYVTNIILITKDYTRLQLQEDVLMSWRSLIKQQSAFVTRYEGSTENRLVDNRRPMEDIMRIEYGDFTDTPSAQSKVNCTLNFNLADTVPMYLVSTISSKVHPTRNQILPPANGLPSINNVLTQADWITILTQDEISTLYTNLFRNSNFASFVNSVVLLPFNPTDMYYTDTAILYCDNYILCHSGFYKINDIPSGDTPLYVKRALSGASPYFVIKDFTFTINDPHFDDFEPYTNYEFYIPFVGWVQVELNKILNKRILIYYTIDNITGNGTAYIYDASGDNLIWSSNCQLGIKMNITTSNSLELEKQKESAQLNLIMGMLSSAISVGVGVASENPVAIAGGVLAGSKAIASYVNTNRQLFKRGQTTFGTGQGTFHAPNDCYYRMTFNLKLTIDETTFKHLNGLPYNNYVSLLSSLTTGYYVEVGEIHFDAKGENIYTTEIDEIVALLKNGVII